MYQRIGTSLVHTNWSISKRVKTKEINQINEKTLEKKKQQKVVRPRPFFKKRIWFERQVFGCL